MSGSDLVPFVAAVLKERVSVELEEENTKLKREIEQLKRDRHTALRAIVDTNAGRFSITGEGGSPVYAFAELAHAVDAVWGNGRKLDLICPDPTLCKISKMEDAEIRINGILLSKLKDADVSDTLTAIGDTDCSWYFTLKPISHRIPGWENIYLSLIVRFWPLPDRFQIDIDTDEMDDDEIKGLIFEKIEFDVD